MVSASFENDLNINAYILEWQNIQCPQLLSNILTRMTSFVKSIVNKYNFQKIDEHILMSEGMNGVLSAMNKFINNGSSFFSYAYYWIKSKVLYYVNNVSTAKYGTYTDIYSKDDFCKRSHNNIDDNFYFCLNSLPIQLRHILEERYFLSLTIEEVAKKRNISFSVARHLEKKAINYLKLALTNDFKYSNLEDIKK